MNDVRDYSMDGGQLATGYLYSSNYGYNNSWNSYAPPSNPPRVIPSDREHHATTTSPLYYNSLPNTSYYAPQPVPIISKAKSDNCIKDVWAHNLVEEMHRISEIVEHFPYISMDTDFPGVVVHPVANNSGNSNYWNSSLNSLQWKTIQCNVNILKIIQLGLTFSDEKGQNPIGVCTWQFNFKFDIDYDMYAQDSIDLLQSSGMDFRRHYQEGIDVSTFAELLMTSGLVLNDEIHWISFHSGYDFGYLLKILTCKDLPEDETAFLEMLDEFFRHVYDIKYIMKLGCSQLNYKAGLSQLASDLKVERIGPMHQAGSDSLITCHTFFKMILSQYFDAKSKPFSFGDGQWKNILYGLGRDTCNDNANTYSSSSKLL